MLLNKITTDAKIKLLESGKTQKAIAKELKVDPSHLSRTIHKEEKIVNATFVDMFEAMGYDIRIEYVPIKPRNNK